MSPLRAMAPRCCPALVRAGALGLLAALAGCGGKGEAAYPEPPPPAPDLTGAVVLLLPSQGQDRFDAELAFWLEEQAPRTTWILPARLKSTVDRSPGWRVQLDALPPGFTEVHGRRRVTGPLYDHLRRLGAMHDARLALIPYPTAAPVADSTGVMLELTGVLVDVMGGRVLWHGTVRGEPAPAGGGPSPASAAEALARALSSL